MPSQMARSSRPIAPKARGTGPGCTERLARGAGGRGARWRGAPEDRLGELVRAGEDVREAMAGSLAVRPHW